MPQNSYEQVPLENVATTPLRRVRQEKFVVEGGEWEDDGNVSVSSSSVLYPRVGASPRRPVHKMSAIKRPAGSPRAQKSTRPARTEGDTVSPPLRRRAQQPQPGIFDTLGYLLSPIKVILSPLTFMLSPIISHTRNVLILGTILLLASWWIWPWVQSFFRPISILLFAIKMPFAIMSSLRPSSMSGESPHFWSGPQLAVQGLWCETVGYGCHSGVQKQTLNPVMVARALTREARTASDIFGSIARLGEGGVEGGLHHIKIWELAAKIMTESSLDEKQHLGQQLKSLGYSTRDISDDMDKLNSKAISTFDWMTWQFESLTRRLSETPNSPVISRSLHSLLVRLSSELDTLERISNDLHRNAVQTEELGSSLIETLGIERHHLKNELALSPGWKRLVDRGKREIVGGELSKAEMVARDVKLTRDTIDNLGTLRGNLDQTRRQVKLFRDQVSEFDASIMGFHLGTDDAGIPLEEEIAVLNRVVQSLDGSVKQAKARASVGW